MEYYFYSDLTNNQNSFNNYSLENYFSDLMNNENSLEKRFINLINSGDLLAIQEMYYNQINNILVDYDMIFIRTCKYGHLEVAKWLLEIKPDINISTENDSAFICACISGNLEIPKWLLEIKPDIYFNGEMSFLACCEKDNLEIAIWLLEIKPTIDISVKNNYAFNFCCEHRNLKTAKWLSEINPNYKLTIENDKIINFWIIKKINTDKSIIIEKESIKNEDLICPICYENEVEIQTNCKHNYCLSCIENVNYKNYVCPYCRTELKYFHQISGKPEGCPAPHPVDFDEVLK